MADALERCWLATSPVLGGDCSLLLGSAWHRGAASSGCVSSMGIRIADAPDAHTEAPPGWTWRWPAASDPPHSQLAGSVPGKVSSVLLVGDRSGDSGYPGAAVRRLREQMFRAPLSALRRNGVGPVLADGLAQLRKRGFDRLWLHLDVDVLNDEIMPAVDSRQPDGLSSELMCY
jgi:arginase